MEGGALLSDWWVEFSKDVVPYVNITSRLETTPDTEVFGQVGGTGFPTTVFMDHEGVVLTDGWLFPGDLETLAKGKADAMKNLTELNALRAKVKAMPDDAAAAGSLKLALALRRAATITPEEFEAIAKLDGVPKDLIARYRVQLILNQFDAIQEKASKGATSQEEFMAAFGEGIYDLFKSGARLPVDNDRATALYGFSLDHAVSISDAATAVAAFAEFEKAMTHMAGENPDNKERIMNQIEEKRKAVDALAAVGAK